MSTDSRGTIDREGIVVLGAPRSGTTLVRRLLDAHPQIACPAETNLLSACGRFLEGETIAQGVDVGVLSGLSFAGFGDDEVIDRLREFAFGFLREHAHRQGKALWAEKTACNAFYLDAIERICGERVHFLCILRHGLDVACSVQELCEQNGGYLRELHPYVQRDARPLEAFARMWVDVTRAIRSLAERRPEQATVIRYEDLAAEPDETMRGVMAGMGQPWDAGLTAAAMACRERVGLGDWKTYARAGIDRSSVDRWRQLPPHVGSGLAAIVNPMLESCGYAAVDVRPQEPGAEARRRYEVGLLLQTTRTANLVD